MHATSCNTPLHKRSRMGCACPGIALVLARKTPGPDKGKVAQRKERWLSLSWSLWQKAEAWAPSFASTRSWVSPAGPLSVICPSLNTEVVSTA